MTRHVMSREEELNESDKDLQEQLTDEKPSRRERMHAEASVHGHKMTFADIFKFAGLIAFFVVMILLCALIWPYVHEIFEPGGLDRVINDVRQAGPVGFLILLAIQFLQVVVAFIPGEVVQVAAGMIYGPWVGAINDVRQAGPVGFLILLAIQFLQVVVAFIPGEVVQVAAGMIYGPWVGALIVLVGCVVSSAFVFLLVHKLGAPFVQAMVSEKHMAKFRTFENSGKLNIIVFVLFLIPGMPKDVFTYLVPLTHMPLRTFLLLSNIARIPGILVSTYAASGLVEGDISSSFWWRAPSRWCAFCSTTRS